MPQHSVRPLCFLGHLFFRVWGWTTIRASFATVLALSVRGISGHSLSLRYFVTGLVHSFGKLLQTTSSTPTERHACRWLSWTSTCNCCVLPRLNSTCCCYYEEPFIYNISLLELGYGYPRTSAKLVRWHKTRQQHAAEGGTQATMVA